MTNLARRRIDTLSMATCLLNVNSFNLKVKHMMRAFTLILACFVLFPATSRAETIKIVADRWCPYNCDPTSDHPGLMIEIAQKAFAKHQIAVEYSIMPWTRAIEETRLNKHTAIVGASHKDAPDFIFPTVAQGWMRNSFFVKKGAPWRYTDMKSLEKISLGAIADYSYNETLDAYILKNKNNPKYVQIVSGDNALDTNVKKLLGGRIGALVEGEYVISYYNAQHGTADKLDIAGTLPPSENDNLFIAFSPKEPKAKEYAEILAKETQAMRKSGELQNILSAYHVKDWQK